METAGSIVDKLSIVNLKLWHAEETAHDPKADDHIVAAAKRRIDSLNLQRNALIQEYDELLWGLFDRLIKSMGVGVNPVATFPQHKDYSKR